MDIVGSRTLRDLWDDMVRDRGDHTFLVFEDRDGKVTQDTYERFGDRIGRAATLFHHLGVSHGDTVALHLNNCPQLLECMFALATLGAVAVPIHPRSAPEECGDIVRRAGVVAMVCEAGLAHLYQVGGATASGATASGAAASGSDRAPIAVPRLLVARGTAPGAASYETERDLRGPFTGRVPVSSDDDVVILFTSGSTAQPKGVVLTHANLIFSGIFVDWEASLTGADRLMTTMPACHVNFQLSALMPVLTAGATLVAIEKYSASRFWRQACDYDATVVQSIAMMVRTQLMQPVADWEKCNKVREVLYYLPITDEEKVRFEERFRTRILNSYGSSETLVGFITDPPLGERRWPSIGRVGLGYEARIADESGREVPAGVLGEIQVFGVAGRTLMKGYYRAPELTAEIYTPDGWMRTGDIGYVDEDGWFYFVDRRSYMIKRSGENISPAEVEAVLAQHPRIAEASVIGVPDLIHDQAVQAFVVPKPGVNLTADDVLTFCRARLAAFKVPGFVDIVDSLPKTGSFKVAKSALGKARAQHDV